MYKAIYKEPKTYLKFDDSHYLCYLNETRELVPAAAEGLTEDLPVAAAAENETVVLPVPSAESEPVVQPLGYAYTGTMPDGATLIEARTATYGDFVSGLIRTEYSSDRVEAIMANLMVAGDDTSHPHREEYIAEWEAFQSFRQECKMNATMLIEGIVEG
jgi:hypothetical protein